MARGGHLLLTILFVTFVGFAGPARAELLPDPSVNLSYVVRGPSKVVLWLFIPRRDHYEIFNRFNHITPVGTARRVASRMILYDQYGHIMGSIRPELLPPDSEMSAVAVVRDGVGKEIGILSRF